MYDLSSKFVKFYEDCVRLSEDEVKSLREKKNLNIDRLKEGLKEYNQENETNYKIIDIIEQGSVAMRTVTQHDRKEYDIDIAIVFENNGELPENTKEVKAFVEDALQRKCSQFKASPQAKTNAVTLEYASGYHIDFAIYRKTSTPFESKYEHCGSEWRERDPKAINNWFKEKNDISKKNIRKVVRLLKMFCKSNPGWLMPGGLIQSILVSEKIQIDKRLDKTFYFTIKAIKERLDFNKEVYNPTLSMKSILYKQKDHQKVKNLCTRLESALKKLEILFDLECSEEQAMKAWQTFFNHTFWEKHIQKSALCESSLQSKNSLLMDLQVDVLIHNKLKVPMNEFTGYLPKESKLIFSVNPRVKYTSIEWIVNNSGDEAGNDLYHMKTGKTVEENAVYRGSHKMTCKIFEGTRLVASKVIPINVR